MNCLKFFERLVERFSFFQTIAYLMPFSPFRGTIWHVLDKKSHKILEIGCERGKLMHAINLHGHVFFRVGVDVFLPYIKYCHQKKIYDECIMADIRHLPFRTKTFDVILFVHVVEHLPKNDGLKVIRNIEEIACRQIIVSTDVGFRKQNQTLDGNPFYVHRSGWSPLEFRKLGYKVRGEFPSFPGSGFLSFVLPLILLVYFSPDYATSMMCIKNVHQRVK